MPSLALENGGDREEGTEGGLSQGLLFVHRLWLQLAQVNFTKQLVQLVHQNGDKTHVKC